MGSSSIYRWKEVFCNFERHFRLTFGLYRQYPPDNHCFSLVSESPIAEVNPVVRGSITIKDIIGDAILWAVPKSRRTIERRMKRRFGDLTRHYKMLIPKKDIIPCNVCGHNYERRHLCGHCYAKVKKETEEMQDKIEATLGLNPIEEEVIVLYRGEKDQLPPEHWQGKRIVEMEKERPPWFSKNLMQKSTAGTSDCVDVKPTELA